MTDTLLTPPRAIDAALVEPDTRVVLAVKTPLDSRAVVAAFPPDYTLERAIAGLRKAIPAHDAEGHAVLDSVERELAASRVDFLVVRADAVVNTPRTSRLHDIATPREMRTPNGLKTVPSVAVEVQAYAAVGLEVRPCAIR
jgi:hypothetical protein